MRILKKILLLFSVFFVLISCSSSVKYYTSYTIYPIGYLLNRIGGSFVNTISIQNSSLVQTANIVDDYDEILDDSIFLFHLGDLEPYLDIYKEQLNKYEYTDVDLSTLNAIYHFQRYRLVYVDGNPNYIEEPYYNGTAFDNIDTYHDDLFLWLDPIGMLSMAKDVYNVLSSNYVEQSAYFKENYESLMNDLISLDAAYQNLATRLKNANTTIKFVSMTASFGSWQKAYGFQVYPVCLSKYGALPNEEQLAIIKQRIIDDGVQYIAYEPNLSSEMMSLFSQLESELSLKRVNLSNISSLSVSQLSDNKDYLSLMYENLSVLENLASTALTSGSTEAVNENITD